MASRTFASTCWNFLLGDAAPRDDRANRGLWAPHHPGVSRVLAALAPARPADDHPAHLGVDPEDLVQHHAPGVPDVPALVAPTPPVERLGRGTGDEQSELLWA